MDTPESEIKRFPNGRLIPGQTIVRNGRAYKVVPNSASRRKPVRASIPSSVREKVKRRDRGTCRYCGAFDTDIHIDHVIPVALGGSNRIGNLVVACRECNTRKGIQLWKPKPLHYFMKT